MTATTMTLADLEASLAGLSPTGAAPQPEPAHIANVAVGHTQVDTLHVQSLQSIGTAPGNITAGNITGIQTTPVTTAMSDLDAALAAMPGPAAQPVPEPKVDTQLPPNSSIAASTLQPQVVSSDSNVIQMNAAPQQLAERAEGDSILIDKGPIMAPLQEFISPGELVRDTTINDTNLDEAIRTHSSKMIHYIGLAVRARRQYELNKAAAEVAESKLYATHREALAAEGKKATEAQVDAAVKADPRWFAVQQRLIDARAIYEMASDGRHAFADRKDMLIQMSVDRRNEMQGDLRIRAAQQTTSDARSEALRAAAGLR